MHSNLTADLTVGQAYWNRFLAVSKAKAGMEEQIKHLVHLFQKADVKRRRKLYEHFTSILDSQNSYVTTIEMLNHKLGANLVSRADVKYIRAHCKKWQRQTTPPEPPAADPIKKPVASQLKWSDADEVPLQHFKKQ